MTTPAPATLRHRLRGLVPKRLREVAYAWHPGRGARWRRWPGLVTVDAPGVVALTFDDGPDAEGTPAVLDALDAAGATATFFVIGEQVQANPELTREIVARGHDLGIHGQRHIRHDQADAESSDDDVRRCVDAVREATGDVPRWFRPPYGKSSDAAAAVCQEFGLTTVYWSAWGLDWEDVDAARIADVACAETTAGGILLLHDSARYGRRSSAQPTADAVALMATEFGGRGLRLVALGEAVS